MTTDHPLQRPALGRKRRPRPRKPETPAWACENCARANAGRRRRCEDCGTSRC